MNSPSSYSLKTRRSTRLQNQQRPPKQSRSKSIDANSSSPSAVNVKVESEFVEERDEIFDSDRLTVTPALTPPITRSSRVTRSQSKDSGMALIMAPSSLVDHDSLGGNVVEMDSKLEMGNNSVKRKDDSNSNDDKDEKEATENESENRNASNAITPERDEANDAEIKDEEPNDHGETKQEPRQSTTPIPTTHMTEEELNRISLIRSQYPMKEINEPTDNDCLFGRGGGTNHHPGNKRYRKMVEDRKAEYLSSKRLDKPLVALDIIREWRAQDPPGRFLKQDEKTKLWYDVGDRKAREKTSQALREKTGKVHGDDDGEGDGGLGGVDKETRFEVGSSPSRKVGKGVMKPKLARDHSLGTELIDGKEFSMEGFSWDEVDQPNKGVNDEGDVDSELQSPVPSSGGVLHYHGRTASYDTAHPPTYPPYVREHSLANNPLSDASVSHPAHNPFGDPYYPPPPPPPPSLAPHPTPPASSVLSPQGHHHHHSSHPGSHPTSHPPIPAQHVHRRREHSLASNPLRGATTTQPAHNTFAEEHYPHDSHSQHMPWGRSHSYDSRVPPPPHPSHAPPPYYAYPPPPTHWGSPPPTPHTPHTPHAPAPPPPHVSLHADYPTHPSPAPPAPYEPQRSQYPPPIVRPSPQRYLTNSNRSAFARMDSDARSNSTRSVGSAASFDYDSRWHGRKDSGQSRKNKGSSASIHFDSQDFSKIADLMSDDGNNERTASGRERSSSWGGYERADEKGEQKLQTEKPQRVHKRAQKEEVPKDTIAGEAHGSAIQVTEMQGGEDKIYRTQSAPHPGNPGAGSDSDTDFSNFFPSPPRNIQTRKKFLNNADEAKESMTMSPKMVKQSSSTMEEVQQKDTKAVSQPSLLRKISGNSGSASRAVAPEGVQRPEPVKRDTSNQPETLETKRSIKRAVLSRDCSAVARNLKEEQQKNEAPTAVGGAKVSSRLSKAEMLDRKISMDMNKLGLSDGPVPLLRMSTEDVLNSLIDDEDLDDGLSTPEALTADDRVTTIDAIAMDITNGRPQSCDVDDALNLILENDPVVDAALESDQSAVNEDIAEKWLKGA